MAKNRTKAFVINNKPAKGLSYGTKYEAIGLCCNRWLVVNDYGEREWYDKSVFKNFGSATYEKQ